MLWAKVWHYEKKKKKKQKTLDVPIKPIPGKNLKLGFEPVVVPMWPGYWYAHPFSAGTFRSAALLDLAHRFKLSHWNTVEAQSCKTNVTVLLINLSQLGISSIKATGLPLHWSVAQPARRPRLADKICANRCQPELLSLTGTSRMESFFFTADQSTHELMKEIMAHTFSWLSPLV